MKVFLDSSVLIEYIKGNQTELLEAVTLPNKQVELCMNHIVFSEFMFHYLALTSNKSPLTLKNSSNIQALLQKHNPIDFINQFTIIPMDAGIMQTGYNFMEQYNLLPNDALILATCKQSKIHNLLTYDQDFKDVCDQENINYIHQSSQIEALHIGE